MKKTTKKQEYVATVMLEIKSPSKQALNQMIENLKALAAGKAVILAGE